jgi:hypothetical protein
MNNHIAAAGNTVVPAVLALESLGYVVTQAGSLFEATNGNDRFVADDPVTVLGLVKLIETRTWSWTASDDTAVVDRYRGVSSA